VGFFRDLADKADAATEKLKGAAKEALERAGETKDALAEAAKSVTDAARGHKDEKK
jgi:hypothetical protein